MRCYCCNNLLTPQQATRKFKTSGVFTDMCDGCLGTIVDDYDIETVEGEVEDDQLFDDDGNPIEESY
jgi:hypothetical protein